MKDVFFDPWVGSCYNSGINGKKIMIMGHVHVCSDCIECGNIKDRDEVLKKLLRTILNGEKLAKFHLQDMKVGLELILILLKHSLVTSLILNKKSVNFGTRCCFTITYKELSLIGIKNQIQRPMKNPKLLLWRLLMSMSQMSS